MACPGGTTVTSRAPPRRTRGGHSAPRGPLLWTTGTSPRSIERGSRFNRRNRAKWVRIQPALTRLHRGDAQRACSPGTGARGLHPPAPRYGDGGGSASLPAAPEAERHPAVEHQQRGFGAAFLLHGDTGPAGPGSAAHGGTDDARHRLIAPSARRETPLPASHRCRPGACGGTCDALDDAKTTPSTADAATKSRPRSSVQRPPPPPTQRLRKPPIGQIPIYRKVLTQSPRVPSLAGIRNAAHLQTPAVGQPTAGIGWSAGLRQIGLSTAR
jgi:hypothetical protein